MAVKGKGVAGASEKGKEVDRASPSAKGKGVAGGPSAGDKRKGVTIAAYGPKSGPGKRARTGAQAFLDEEADDAGFDEDEGSDSGESDFMDDEEEEDVGKALDLSRQFPKSSRLSALRFDVKEETENDAEMEKYIRERFGSKSKYVKHADEWEDSKGLIDRQVLAPTKADPNIWKVKCKLGKERHLTFCLIEKFRSIENVNNELKNVATDKDGLKIISAFALDHAKGFIFVEADRECDVVEACKGFCNIYISRITLVPKNEVPHLLSVQNKTFKVSVGTWVRMKAGIYKGDLAKVVDFDSEKERVMIKLIPRIDLEAIAQKYGGGVSCKPAKVPAARLIRPFQLKDFQTHIESRRDQQTGEVFQVLDGMMLRNGFLFKKVSLGSLSYWEIKPSESEIKQFVMAEGGIDDADFVSTVDSGRKRPARVKVEKTSETCESSSGTKTTNRFQVMDFVMVNQKDFGVIIAFEEEDSLKILKGKSEMEEEVISIKMDEIKNQIYDRMFTALDKEKTRISIGDGVKVSLGRYEGKEGFVKHMYRGALFIQDANQSENLGLFVTRADLVFKTCSKVTGLKGTGLASNLLDSENSENPNPESPKQSMGRDTFRSCPSTSQVYDHPFSIGQTLRIRVGPLKGHLCKVIALFRADVAVKLQSNSKVIRVSCDDVSELKNRGNAVSADLPASEFEKPFGEDISGGSTSGIAHENDPWGNNIDKSSQQMDGWNLEPATVKDQENDPWGNKTEKVQEDDPWGKKSDVASQPTDDWNALPTPDKTQENDLWASKTDQSSQQANEWNALPKSDKENDSDPWGSKTDKPSQPVDEWSAQGSVGQDRESDAWGSKVGQSSLPKDDWNPQPETTKDQENDPWGSKASQSSQPKDDWNTQPETTKHQENDPWGTKAGQSSQPKDDWNTQPETTNDQESDPWGSKAGPSSQPKDAWGTQSESGKEPESDPWSSKTVQSSQPADGWGAQLKTGEDKANDSWGGDWGKSDKGDDWGKPKNDDTVWGKPSNEIDHEGGNQNGSWNNNSFGGRGYRGRGGGDFNGGRRGGGRDFSGGRRGGRDFGGRGDFGGGRRGGGDFGGGRRGGGDFSGGRGRFSGRGRSGGWNEDRNSDWSSKKDFSDNQNSWKDEGNASGGWKSKNSFGEGNMSSGGWNKGGNDGKEEQSGGGWSSKNSLGEDNSTSGWNKGANENKNSDVWNSNSATGGWNNVTSETSEKSGGWNSNNAFGENKPSWNSEGGSSGGWNKGSNDRDNSSGWGRGGDDGGRGGRRGGRRGGFGRSDGRGRGDGGFGRNNGRGRGDGGYSGWNSEKGEGGNGWSSGGNRGGRGGGFGGGGRGSFGGRSQDWSSSEKGGWSGNSDKGGQGGWGGNKGDQGGWSGNSDKGGQGGGWGGNSSAEKGGWSANSDKGCQGGWSSSADKGGEWNANSDKDSQGGWSASSDKGILSSNPQPDSWDGSKNETTGGQAGGWNTVDAPGNDAAAAADGEESGWECAAFADEGGQRSGW